jgi:hypothetical protein
MFSHNKPGDFPDAKGVEPLRVKKDIIRYFLSLKDHSQSQKLEHTLSDEENAELRTYYQSLRDGTLEPEQILHEFQPSTVSEVEYDAIPEALLHDDGMHLPTAFVFRVIAGTLALVGLLVYLFASKSLENNSALETSFASAENGSAQKGTKSTQDRLLRKEVRNFSGKSILFVDLELPQGDAPKRYMAQDLMGLRDDAFYGYRFRYFSPQDARQPHSDFFACPEKLTLSDRFKFHDSFDGMVLSWNDHKPDIETGPIRKDEPISSAPR